MRIVQVELDPKDIADIVHTAIEGGINYWGECRNYKWQTWYETNLENPTEKWTGDKLKDLPADFVYVEVREDDRIDEPTRKPNTWVKIRKADIERGFALAFAKHPHMYQARDGEVDMDAYGAETIIQYAIFGELVYG